MRVSYMHGGESEKAERTTEEILKNFLCTTTTTIAFFLHHNFSVYCIKRDLRTNEREKGDVKLQGIILNFILPFSFLLFFHHQLKHKRNEKNVKINGFFHSFILSLFFCLHSRNRPAPDGIDDSRIASNVCARVKWKTEIMCARARRNVKLPRHKNEYASWNIIMALKFFFTHTAATTLVISLFSLPSTIAFFHLFYFIFLHYYFKREKKMKMYFSVSEIMCSCEYILQAVEREERTRQKARWNQHFSVVSGFLCWIDAKKEFDSYHIRIDMRILKRT